MQVVSVSDAYSRAGTPVPRKLVLLVLFLSLVIQLLIASFPSVGDSQFYKLWIRALANEGIAAAYWDKPIASATDPQAYYSIDYPPVYPYLLEAEGIVLKSVMPAMFQNNDRIVVFFVKVPFIAANLLICLLLFSAAKQRTTETRALAATAAYAFNPAVLFITCYWGQSDSFCGLLILIAMVLFLKQKPELSSLFLTLAFFTKPIAYPFVLLFVVGTAKRFGFRRLASSFVVSAVTTFAIFLPFISMGRFDDISRTVLLQVDTMPWVSSNAHNLWWIFSGGLPWLDANTKVLGWITYKFIGMFFFGIFCIATLRKYWLSDLQESLFFVCASLSFGLFTLSTHMHAYHLFYALMFLTPLTVMSRRLRMLYVLLTVTSLTNMVLYDLLFIYLSIPGMVLTMLNSQLCVILFLYWLFLYYRGSTFDSVTEKASLKPRGRNALIALAAVFVLGTSAPIVHKVSRFEVEHYFINNWRSAKKKLSPIVIRQDIFGIQNDQRPVLFQHPPSELVYHLKMPNRCRLLFSIALAPVVWSPERGNGVSFAISIHDQQETRMLFSSYIDPKTNLADRRWSDYDVDLSAYGSKDVQVRLITGAGPGNDSRFDWAGWGDPRMICE